MTITRIAQLTAEDRVITPISIPLSLSSFPSISSAQAYTGTYSYNMGASAIQFGIAVPTPTSAYRLGYWLRHPTFDSGNLGMLYRAANGVDVFESPTFGVRVNSTAGLLEIVRPVSGTTNDFEVFADVAIPSSLAEANAWTHIGITHKIAETDGFLSVYIAGIEVLTYIGDTRLYGQNNGSPIFATTAAYIWGAGNRSTGGGAVFPSSCFVDDWYLDSYVGEADAPVPARRFLMVLPTGVGADDDWTSEPSADNYANVDDNPNDGDSTYVKALAADLRDTYAYGNISLPADHRIIAVLPSPFAKRLDTELDHKISVHAWDGSDYLDSAELDLSMSFDVPVFARFTVQPDTSAWDETDFNNCQFGAKSAGTF
jgi:hypothetical protein